MSAPVFEAIKGAPGIAGFAERLKCVRLMRQMRQCELAERCAISKAHLSEIESGKKSPSIENLRLLCLVLNVSADYLLDSHVSSTKEVA